MKIQIGEIKMEEVIKQQIIPNKTKNYLLPCLLEYGEEFINRITNVFKVAVGIGDIVVSNRNKYVFEKHIFVLIDSRIAPKHFIEFLEWIKNHDSYVEDYVYGNIQKSNLHMVILKFPTKYYTAFDSFKLGKYSQMFSKETIDKFFEKNPGVKGVLVKGHLYKILFTKKVNRTYNLIGDHKLKPEDWNPDEYDFPPTEESEIFNHHLKKIKK